MERAQRIDALLSAALRREEAERAFFLADACEGDENLRREVQELLSAVEAAGGVLGAPPTDAAVPAVPGPEESQKKLEATLPLGHDLGDLERGSALGRYIVLSKLGGGGMGVVYAAYDPELDRKVAVKLWQAGAAKESKGQGMRE